MNSFLVKCQSSDRKMSRTIPKFCQKRQWDGGLIFETQTVIVPVVVKYAGTRICLIDDIPEAKEE
jgi:hypothetical protein